MRQGILPMCAWKVVFAGGKNFSKEWIKKGVEKKIIDETDSPAEVEVDDEDLAVLLTRLGSRIRIVGIDVMKKRVFLPAPVPDSSTVTCPACNGSGTVPLEVAAPSKD
jgi:hypothetical protein